MPRLRLELIRAGGVRRSLRSLCARPLRKAGRIERCVRQIRSTVSGGIIALALAAPDQRQRFAAFCRQPALDAGADRAIKSVAETDTLGPVDLRLQFSAHRDRQAIVVTPGLQIGQGLPRVVLQPLAHRIAPHLIAEILPHAGGGFGHDPAGGARPLDCHVGRVDGRGAGIGVLHRRHLAVAGELVGQLRLRLARLLLKRAALGHQPEPGRVRQDLARHQCLYLGVARLLGGLPADLLGIVVEAGDRIFDVRHLRPFEARLLQLVDALEGQRRCLLLACRLGIAVGEGGTDLLGFGTGARQRLAGCGKRRGACLGAQLAAGERRAVDAKLGRDDRHVSIGSSGRLRHRRNPGWRMTRCSTGTGSRRRVRRERRPTGSSRPPPSCRRTPPAGPGTSGCSPG